MRYRGSLVCLLAIVAAAGVRPAPAEEQKNSEQSAFKGSPLAWSVPKIMDIWVAQVTRYYNLDADQEEYTRKLMAQRVKRFLAEYEDQVRTLFAEYLDYRTTQKVPPPEVAKEFSRRAGPLMQAIRKEIIDGNMEWREILKEDQKKKHDRDLQQMNQYFDQFDTAMQRWSKGEVRPADFGRISDTTGGVRQMESGWEIYVKHFIQNYRLDDGQQQTAYSVLNELKDAARRYRESRTEDFTRLEADQKKLFSTPKMEPAEREKYKDQLSELTRRRQEIERPISSLFDQLRSRLDGIPTADQRRNFDERSARFGRGGPTTQTALGTRPAGAETRPTTPPTSLGTQPAQADAGREAAHR